ncbi:uncharacterized protein LOC133706695 [Rosa rugosa]|uniref:uncharacterized protein LOC133706695 n=1 Tax=Rosa rugosa TaxID=74645 RepID=UPI002B4090E3|nr:uncharacterized protein LOC133706695 [Rosa rugosa]XP_061988224.1 uncharacterized protein LOC133706695 [Rosa rugosa]
MKRCSESRQSIAVKRSNHTMDFTSGRSFICTAYKSIISSICLLWGSRSTCHMQTPKDSMHQNLKSGLKTLIFNPKSHNHGHIVHKNYKLAPPSPSSQSSLTYSWSLLDNSSSWTSSMMDDLLGTDSGVAYMTTSNDDMLMSMTTSSYPKRKSTRGSKRVKREFPPPIPLLAQTRNLQCRMPWNLTRHYSNGRLILKGEKARHHEYFEAERDSGRLVLKLVPLDNTILTTYDVTESFGGHLDVCEENDEELEMENVQFAQEDYPEDDNDDADDDEDDADADADDDECDDNVDELCKSVPQSHSEISRCVEKYGNLPMYFTKSAARVHEQPQNYFAHPASAPLRPVTAVI